MVLGWECNWGGMLLRQDGQVWGHPGHSWGAMKHHPWGMMLQILPKDGAAQELQLDSVLP